MIYAGPGVDTIAGADGPDRLFARAQTDVSQPGADTVSGGDGDDHIYVRDGEADQVSCGDGRDVVIADSTDVISQELRAGADRRAEAQRR